MRPAAADRAEALRHRRPQSPSSWAFVDWPTASCPLAWEPVAGCSAPGAGGQTDAPPCVASGYEVNMIDAGHRRHTFAVGLVLTSKAAGRVLGTRLDLLAGRLSQGLFAHHHPLAIKGQHLNRLGLGRLLECG